MKSKIGCIIIIYLGNLPKWMQLYLESCKWNQNFDFLIFSDDNFSYLKIPQNVKMLPLTMEEFNNLYLSKFPYNNPIKYPYKLCDLKPSYGFLFYELIKEYQYFGWGDLDVIYGNIRKYLTDEMLTKEVISFNKNHISGHLCLVKTKIAKTVHFCFPGWARQVNSSNHMRLDEPAYLNNVSYYLGESFNTPLSKSKPWTSNTFKFPDEWYWGNGVLTNNLDGEREFPYLHFMYWRKGSTWQKIKKTIKKLFNLDGYGENDELKIKCKNYEKGFKINKKGFFDK